MDQMNPRYSQDDGTLNISLREVLAPLFRRKRLLITTFLVVLGSAILFGILFPAPYKAHMEVLVQRDRLDPLVSTEATSETMTGSPTVTEEETNSEVELLQSHDVLEKVVLNSGLSSPRKATFMGKIEGFFSHILNPWQTNADRVESSVRKLAKKLKVESQTKSNIIDVTYKSSDPEMSYSVMHALANAYMEKHLAVHRPAGSSQFFTAETEKSRKALADAEGRLRDFSRSQGLSAPDVERTDLAQSVATAIGQLATFEQQYAADEGHLRSDQAQMNSTPKRSTTLESVGPADKLLDDLNSQLVLAQTKRTQLAMKYDAQYPLVREADQEIALTKAAIADAENKKYLTRTTDTDPTYELLREDAAKTEADMATQHASVVSLKRGIQSMQKQMVDLDQKALIQQDMLRDVKINEDNYLLYQAKKEQERATDALDKTRIANVAIADPPEVPALPVYSWPLFLVCALAGAFVLAVGLVYVLDYLDPSFHSPAQVIDILDIPIVIAVPKKKTA